MTRPWIVKNAGQIELFPLPLPFVGPHEIAGWMLDQVFLVDCSKCGRVGDPALTFNQFKKRLQIGKGYGLIGFGKFQVTVGEYTKV